MLSLITTLISPGAEAEPAAAESKPKPTPLYTPESVPRIKNAKRLANVRRKQLLRAAEREYDDPPPPPGLGECCGSSCDPCVRDLWREELACWRERWGDGAAEGGQKKTDKEGNGNGDTSVDKDKDQGGRRMPGSYDW